MNWIEKIARWMGFVPVSALEDMNKVRRKTLEALDEAQAIAESRQDRIEELEDQLEQASQPSRVAESLNDLNARADQLLGPLAPRGVDKPIIVSEYFDVQWFFAEQDGVPVVQVDTENSASGRIRINLNDAPVWDGDPETDDHPGANFRA